MRVLELFAGIGGAALGAEAAGLEHAAFVENNMYCRSVLKYHWPEVPQYGDIFSVTGAVLQEDGIGPIDIISGGFPCQPFSVAGISSGTRDSRHLWPQFSRLIGEVRPRWVVGENVRGLLSNDGGKTIQTILEDLACMGYAVGWAVYGAESVGAPHQRNRVFIVAHDTYAGRETCSSDKVRIGQGTREGLTTRSSFEVRVPVTAKPKVGMHIRRTAVKLVMCPRWPKGEGVAQWLWEEHRLSEPEEGRLKSLHALGNICVPQQIYPVFKAIVDWELGR